jgi:hypothetical protein
VIPGSFCEPFPVPANGDDWRRHNYWQRSAAGEAPKIRPSALYFSSGKTAWVGMTDKSGNFASTKIMPGNYRLEVSGWGNTAVELNRKLDQLPNGQTLAWNLSLTDDACVGAGMSAD